jgi:hypothetical protein
MNLREFLAIFLAVTMCLPMSVLYAQNPGEWLAMAPASGDSSQHNSSVVGHDWLALAETPAEEKSAASEPSPLGYVPWQKRYGPAYGADIRSFGRDAKELPETLWDDTKALATNPFSLVFLGLAGAAGIALSGPNGNDQVAEHYYKHGSQLNTFWDSVGDAGGNPGTHFALAGTMYFLSLANGDNKLYENSKTLLNALAINGLLTMGLKVCARTESPNGDEYGWPSGHTSSSFTVAQVMAEQYGPWVGIPFYGFASYVGYERIDAQNHDFSDVISGALIGIAVGHAVANNHQMRFMDMNVMPYVNPSRGEVGVGMSKRW